jgi:pimeloyl-ACP methyl ester carboxylesterase
MARGILRWTGKALLWLVVVLLVLAAIGMVYQAVATERAEGAHPPPGETVDVGDHELHIDCVDQGSPTVVLEAALGNASAHWVRVQQEVSEVTRVCTYDRAGMGWSEGGPEPQDAARVTGELHALLEGAGVEGPYVMVGHSFGGLYARAYAARYPDETAGVVLVDSSHPDQFERLPDGPENYAQARRLFAVAPLFARLGVIRLFDLLPVPAELPAPQRAQVEAFNPATKQVSTTADEFRATPRPPPRCATQEAWATSRSRSSAPESSLKPGSSCKRNWPPSRPTAPTEWSRGRRTCRCCTIPMTRGRRARRSSGWWRPRETTNRSRSRREPKARRDTYG